MDNNPNSNRSLMIAVEVLYCFLVATFGTGVAFSLVPDSPAATLAFMGTCVVGVPLAYVFSKENDDEEL